MMMLRRTQGIIVLGEKLKYLFSDFFYGNNIFVVPNGADYEISTFKRTENPSSIHKLLYLGNLQPSKGIEDDSARKTRHDFLRKIGYKL